MIKRVVEISTAGTYLSVKLGQLIVKQEGQVKGQISCEDIGVLLIDHQGISYTHSVFTELLAHGAAVVLCNGTHHPAGMLLPLETNTVQTERFRNQINAKEPLKKKLWQQIVRAKIKHQAKLVHYDQIVYKILLDLQKKVRSGDPDNIEAQASQKYWSVYLQNEAFRRKRDGIGPNNLLNYGYMVMRAAVARALCSAGLLATLGIHHRNKYNAFCLADDVIEPFRGFVEERAREIFTNKNRGTELDKENKAALLEVLYRPVVIGGTEGPLLVGLHRTAASLARCYAGEQDWIDLPEL